VVLGVDHVQLGVVAELVLAADHPDPVVVLHCLRLAERHGQLLLRHLEVAGLAVVPVQELDAVDHLTFDVLPADHEELHVALLLLQTHRRVEAGEVEALLEHARVLHDGVHLALHGRTLLVVLAADHKDLLTSLVLLHRGEGAVEFELSDALVNEGG
jgi:hypothetical protein